MQVTFSVLFNVCFKCCCQYNNLLHQAKKKKTGLVLTLFTQILSLYQRSTLFTLPQILVSNKKKLPPIREVNFLLSPPAFSLNHCILTTDLEFDQYKYQCPGNADLQRRQGLRSSRGNQKGFLHVTLTSLVLLQKVRHCGLIWCFALQKFPKALFYTVLCADVVEESNNTDMNTALCSQLFKCTCHI